MSSSTACSGWRARSSAFFLALVLALGAGAAAAQPYPAKPIRLVVPTAASTPIDIVSRLVAEKLGARLGQPVVVELKPGATGALGAQEVLAQPADGYTLITLFMPMSVAQTIYSQVPFDLRRDFEPVGQTAWSYNVLVVHPSVNAASVKELAGLLAAQPGKLSFSSGGAGTPAHISGELFKIQTGTEALHVPYNQFPQAITDLLSGQNQFMFAATPPVIGHVRSGKLRALAVTGPKRIASMPEVPTMAEAGYPDFVVRDWQGFAARAGTPQKIVDQLNAALVGALQTEEMRTALAKLGVDAAPGPAAGFGRLIDAEVERWARVARAARLTAQ